MPPDARGSQCANAMLSRGCTNYACMVFYARRNRLLCAVHGRTFLGSMCIILQTLNSSASRLLRAPCIWRHVRVLRPYFIGNHSALCDKKRAGKYNKYTYWLLTILYKTSYSKYCMTLYASVCCDSCLCGLCLHYNTTTCIYSYMSRIYHYVSRLYIIEGYGLSHRLKCL